MALSARMSLGEAAREVGRVLREFAAPIGAAAIVLAIALGLFAALRRHEDRQIAERVDLEGRYLESAMTRALERRTLDMLALARRWEGIEAPQEAEWARDAMLIVRRDPAYRGIEWRDEAFQPVWSVPLTARRTGADLDTAFDAERASAAVGSSDRPAGHVSASYPGPGARRLVMFVAPMLRGGSRVGVIAAVAHVRDVIDAIVMPEVRRGFAVAVTEGPYRVYGPLASAEGDEEERWRRARIVRVGDLVWTIDYWPTGQLLDRLRSYGPPLVLFAGVFGAMFAAAAVRALELAGPDRRTAASDSTAVVEVGVVAGTGPVTDAVADPGASRGVGAVDDAAPRSDAAPGPTPGADVQPPAA